MGYDRDKELAETLIKYVELNNQLAVVQVIQQTQYDDVDRFYIEHETKGGE